jgi:hypothetical protein
MNLKIYDKKYNNNESLAEIYTYLKYEYLEISKYREKNSEAFHPLESVVEKLETKEAINKMVVYWGMNLTYFSHINFLTNIVILSEKSRKTKKKEIRDFVEIANSHITNQLNASIALVQIHISYLYFKYIESRKERNFSQSLLNAYLEAFQSAVEAVDSELGNAASKFAEMYTLETLIEQNVLQKIKQLENMTKS